MAGEKANDKQPEEQEAVKKPRKKGRLRRLVLQSIGLLALFGIFTGGVMAGPEIGKRLRVPGYELLKTKYEVKKKKEKAASRPPAPTMRLDPVIVDVKSKDGMLHHVKVGIAVELKKGVKVEEAELFMPRARDAVITYVRSLRFDQLSEIEQFDKIRDELGKRVIDAVGTSRAQRILFTDFVIQ